MIKDRITVFTIGFVGKSAEDFFSALRRHGIRRLIDVRLFNRSQLAGFSKQSDLKFFLREILGAEYVHMTELAPTEALLNAYKNGEIGWQEYETQYQAILKERRPEQSLTPQDMNHACLLCSEPMAERCHRRLAAEYFQHIWPEITIRHL